MVKGRGIVSFSHPMPNIHQRRVERNVITNIGNQFMTFLHIRRKNEEALSRIAPELMEEQLTR